MSDFAKSGAVVLGGAGGMGNKSKAPVKQGAKPAAAGSVFAKLRNFGESSSDDSSSDEDGNNISTTTDGGADESETNISTSSGGASNKENKDSSDSENDQTKWKDVVLRGAAGRTKQGNNINPPPTMGKKAAAIGGGKNFHESTTKFSNGRPAVPLPTRPPASVDDGFTRDLSVLAGDRADNSKRAGSQDFKSFKALKNKVKKNAGGSSTFTKESQASTTFHKANGLLDSPPKKMKASKMQEPVVLTEEKVVAAKSDVDTSGADAEAPISPAAKSEHGHPGESISDLSEIQHVASDTDSTTVQQSADEMIPFVPCPLSKAGLEMENILGKASLRRTSKSKFRTEPPVASAAPIRHIIIDGANIVRSRWNEIGQDRTNDAKLLAAFYAQVSRKYTARFPDVKIKIYISYHIYHQWITAKAPCILSLPKKAFEFGIHGVDMDTLIWKDAINVTISTGSGVLILSNDKFDDIDLGGLYFETSDECDDTSFWMSTYTNFAAYEVDALKEAIQIGRYNLRQEPLGEDLFSLASLNSFASFEKRAELQRRALVGTKSQNKHVQQDSGLRDQILKAQTVNDRLTKENYGLRIKLDEQRCAINEAQQKVVEQTTESLHGHLTVAQAAHAQEAIQLRSEAVHWHSECARLQNLVAHMSAAAAAAAAMNKSKDAEEGVHPPSPASAVDESAYYSCEEDEALSAEKANPATASCEGAENATGYLAPRQIDFESEVDRNTCDESDTSVLQDAVALAYGVQPSDATIGTVPAPPPGLALPHETSEAWTSRSGNVLMEQPPVPFHEQQQYWNAAAAAAAYWSSVGGVPVPPNAGFEHQQANMFHPGMSALENEDSVPPMYRRQPPMTHAVEHQEIAHNIPVPGNKPSLHSFARTLQKEISCTFPQQVGAHKAQLRGTHRSHAPININFETCVKERRLSTESLVYYQSLSEMGKRKVKRNFRHTLHEAADDVDHHFLRFACITKHGLDRERNERPEDFVVIAKIIDQLQEDQLRYLFHKFEHDSTSSKDDEDVTKTSILDTVRQFARRLHFTKDWKNDIPSLSELLAAYNAGEKARVSK